jgi:hypothetical protein
MESAYDGASAASLHNAQVFYFSSSIPDRDWSYTAASTQIWPHPSLLGFLPFGGLMLLWLWLLLKALGPLFLWCTNIVLCVATLSVLLLGLPPTHSQQLGGKLRFFLLDTHFPPEKT